MLGWFSLSMGSVVDVVDVSLRLKMRVRSLLSRCPELCDCQSWVASRYGGFHFPSGSSFSASEDNHPNLRSSCSCGRATVTFAPGPWAQRQSSLLASLQVSLPFSNSLGPLIFENKLPRIDHLQDTKQTITLSAQRSYCSTQAPLPATEAHSSQDQVKARIRLTATRAHRRACRDPDRCESGVG